MNRYLQQLLEHGTPQAPAALLGMSPPTHTCTTTATVTTAAAQRLAALGCDSKQMMCCRHPRVSKQVA